MRNGCVIPQSHGSAVCHSIWRNRRSKLDLNEEQHFGGVKWIWFTTWCGQQQSQLRGKGCIIISWIRISLFIQGCIKFSCCYNKKLIANNNKLKTLCTCAIVDSFQKALLVWTQPGKSVIISTSSVIEVLIVKILAASCKVAFYANHLSRSLSLCVCFPYYYHHP